MASPESMAGSSRASRPRPDSIVIAGALSAAASDGHTPRYIVRRRRSITWPAVLAIAWTRTSRGAPWRGYGARLGAAPSRVDVVLDLTGLDHVLEDNPMISREREAGMTARRLAERSRAGVSGCDGSAGMAPTDAPAG